ncbi:hypothetical protein ACOMHN_046103 [Nucella lapillus]
MPYRANELMVPSLDLPSLWVYGSSVVQQGVARLFSGTAGGGTALQWYSRGWHGSSVVQQGVARLFSGTAGGGTALQCPPPAFSSPYKPQQLSHSNTARKHKLKSLRTEQGKPLPPSAWEGRGRKRQDSSGSGKPRLGQAASGQPVSGGEMPSWIKGLVNHTKRPGPV